jgi:hypothetical protein
MDPQAAAVLFVCRQGLKSRRKRRVFAKDVMKGLAVVEMRNLSSYTTMFL